MPGNLLTKAGREQAQLASSRASEVGEKIRSGEYTTEETACFCGGSNDKVLVEQDRYGMPHRMVVCQDCALVRANPRMTSDAYRRFYNEDYRIIHFAEVEENQQNRGEYLKIRLVEFDLKYPSIVVEFGCHKGGLLDVFKSGGSKTYGVEIDKEAAAHARSKNHAVVPAVDDLIAQGIKADLIVMQDAIEHLLDLREVEKLKELLAPGGYLYVWTPGYFRSDLRRLWQLAHTYQFCRASLEYVMNELGFDALYCDEDIESLWGIADGSTLKAEKAPEWAGYILDDFYPQGETRKMPPFRGVCKFTPKTLYENIEGNLARRLPDLHALTATRFGGDIVIVGGGPSVDLQIDEIRKLITNGADLMVISRMYPWTKKLGLKPDYVVSLDCMPDQEHGFSDLQPGVIYLLATVARPSIFEKLQGESIYIWDTKDDPRVRASRLANGYEIATVINGGGSVTISCLSLAMNIGYRRLHVFGLDCMMADLNQTHAEGIAGESVQQRVFEVEISGKVYFTTASFLEFARQTLDLVSAGHESGMLEEIKFYGESLINKMWDGVFHSEEAV